MTSIILATGVSCLKKTWTSIFLFINFFVLFFNPHVVFSKERDFKNILDLPPVVEWEKPQGSLLSPKEEKEMYKLTLPNDKSTLFVTPEGVQFANEYSPLPTADKFRFTEVLKKLFRIPVSATGDEKCLTCHRGIEEISKNHPFACSKCHKGNPNSKVKKQAHKQLVSNPSDLSVAEQFCGECHEELIENVKNSPMATSVNEINKTRYQWGAQESFDYIYGIKKTSLVKALPSPKVSTHDVDDMLRKKCLRCHLYSESPNRRGEYRSSGCSACHMIYTNDGKSKSQDMAIQKIQSESIKTEKHNLSTTINKKNISGLQTRRGYPVLHSFTVSVPTNACVRCHSGNRTGSEYIGIMEHSGKKEFNPPVISEIEDDIIYGARQHLLLPDIHFTKGLHCIDCHPQTDKHKTVTVTCEDCHGTPDTTPQTSFIFDADYALKAGQANPIYELKIGDTVLKTGEGIKLGHIKTDDKRFILTSKVTGVEHKIPLLANLSRQPVSHKISSHIKKIECHTCHSAWTSYRWGRTYKKGIKGTNEKLKGRWFVDPQLQNIQFLGKEEKADEMIDWLKAKQTAQGITGTMTKGVWWDFEKNMEWGNLIGIVNSRGKVSTAKPLYLMEGASKSQKNKKSPKQTFIPYAPHTQQKFARPCEACHQNKSFVGLGGNPSGEGLDKVVSTKGKSLQPVLSKDARFFNNREINRLLVKSKKYKYYRYLDLKEKGWKKLFDR